MAPDRKPHIEVENLEIHYGDVPAVRGVSFSVQPGEQLTLLGPSGCGKTTSLRAIAGLEQPTAGEIHIGGAPVYSSAQRVNIPAEKRGLSMVFQSYAIWPHMTVFENVAYGLRVRRESKEQIAREGRSRARHGADARLPRPRRLAALRRAAAARRAGARLRVPALGAAVRRAALEPRRQAARRHAHRAARAAAPARHHVGLRDARPRRGAGDVRPHRGDARRPDRADRLAVRHLQSAAQRVRRRLRRLGQPDPRAQSQRSRDGRCRSRWKRPAGHIVTAWRMDGRPARNSPSPSAPCT